MCAAGGAFDGLGAAAEALEPDVAAVVDADGGGQDGVEVRGEIFSDASSHISVILSAAKDLIAVRHKCASELLAMRSFTALRMTRGFVNG